MKKLNIAIMLGLGISLSFTAMADEDDMVIRMMDMNETAQESVMKEIELPESASDMGRERSAKGIANANERRALNREREHEDDDVETDENEMESDDSQEMVKEDNMTGHERADEVRATPERPETPDRPETPERPELPEAAQDHRADRSHK